ncbi:MAG: NAD(P)/FAD-dependent oxidoreductase [Bacteroidetes bacterium]|nr:NAD(P)/FAD-dependent oxidoreductase [Bacteroidota bacterium]MCW5894741.1 NAD(P)/FAD-dependent oxidoreductase [Bacteroidota bacterium]
MSRPNPIFVIGGGAAGIIAACRAASLGARVLLLERNSKLGIKLLISGGGKCNITHAGPMEEVRAAFVPHEARFLKPSFYTFSNDDIVRMIEDAGVATYTRPNGRVFPVSGNADDVVNALAGYLKKEGVQLRLNARVSGIVHREDAVRGLMIGNVEIESEHIILATGGASYPKTGTKGDGFEWARALGHTIVPVRPALAPIGIEPKLPADWRGVALRDGCLMVFADGRKLTEWRDDILFSHEGITGPAALEVSRVAAEAMLAHDVELRFDFFPQKDFTHVDDDLNKLVLSKRDRMISTLLESWLPNRIVHPLLQSVGIDAAKRGHVLTREERRKIVQLLKDWKLGNVSSINIERGEVTAGGVALDEVDPKSMRSRKVKGLYICGEVLDIAGPVGGYNLQAAFSTGFVAGETAAKDWLALQGD